MLDIDRQNDGSSAYAATLALKSDGQTQTAGDMHIPAQGHVASVDCVGDLHMGPGATAHVVRATYIFLDEAATVRDVACASEMMCVQPHCLFRWLDAPTIAFTASARDNPLAKNAALPASLPDTGIPAKKQKKFTRIEGSWKPQPQTQLDGDYVVTMDVELAQGCIVAGSIKAYGNVILGERSGVLGSVFSAGKVELLPAAQVLGVISAGREVHLHAGSAVGRVDQLSSVNAPMIVAHAGAWVHGSLKARRHGQSRT
jgi:cytoskeletal protein CcmA (bactofilin family)